MPDTQRLCRTCGSALVKKPGRGRWPHYCSDECRADPGRYEAYNASRRKPDGKCLDCGVRIPARNKRCEQHAAEEIARQKNSRQVSVTCSWCATVVTKSRRGSRYAHEYCGLECRDRHQAALRREHRLPIGPVPRTMIDVVHVEGRQPELRFFTAGICKKCATPFVATRTTSFCSEWCAKRYRKNIDKKLRRARVKGAARVEVIDPLKVYERDGWTCRLCRRAIKRDLDPQHPRAASIDHILPLALGGTHTYDNVQSAHRICNVRKNTGVEQLAFAC